MPRGPGQGTGGVLMLDGRDRPGSAGPARAPPEGSAAAGGLTRARLPALLQSTHSPRVTSGLFQHRPPGRGIGCPSGEPSGHFITRVAQRPARRSHANWTWPPLAGGPHRVQRAARDAGQAGGFGVGDQQRGGVSRHVVSLSAGRRPFAGAMPPPCAGLAGALRRRWPTPARRSTPRGSWSMVLPYPYPARATPLRADGVSLV